MGFVLFINGLVLAALGLAMGGIGLFFPEARQHFFAASIATGFVGTLICLATSPRMHQFHRLHGFMLTASVWLTAAAAGAVPLWLWRLSPTDAFFEAISGITTTGSTVISGLDAVEPGILLWRAILQWVGGVGFIVTGIALLPMLRVGGMQLFRTESSDKGDKEFATAARFAAATLWIYLSLTATCALIYLLGGMTGFEAIAHALTTLSTGGYSTSDASFGQFSSLALRWAGTVFMLAGALPFAWYIRALRTGRMSSEQTPALIYGLAAVILPLTLWRVATSDDGWFQTLTDTAFSVVSVVTTTGFATVDYTTWGAPVVVSFFVLTAFGGCTGSTAGGVKAMRWLVLGRYLLARVRMVHAPHAVLAVRYEGRTVTQDQLTGIITFFSLFFLSFTLLSITLVFLGLDFESALSGALTSLANVGPGVGPIIGPAGNFALLPDAAKWVLSLGMYIGRLEMMTVFVLILPAYWREIA